MIKDKRMKHGVLGFLALSSLAAAWLWQTSVTPSASQSILITELSVTDPSDISMPQLTSEPASNDREEVRQFGHLSIESYDKKSMYGERPAHLRDIELQKLYFDQHGNFIVTDNLRYLIEHFMLGSNDEGVDMAMARIREYIELTLPPSAASQALEICNMYYEYKTRANEEGGIDYGSSDAQTLVSQMEAVFAKRQQIRREVLTDEVIDAFFGAEERYDEFSLMRVKINTNNALSYEEKDALIAQAELKLPENIQTRMRHKREEKNLYRKIDQLKAEGDNQSEIYQLRKDFYGKDAADRLAYYEDNSVQWQARVNQYNESVAQIIQQESLSVEEKRTQINLMKQSQFSEKEQMKLSIQNIRARIAQVN